jgi:hypothetical protein
VLLVVTCVWAHITDLLAIMGTLDADCSRKLEHSVRMRADESGDLYCGRHRVGSFCTYEGLRDLAEDHTRSGVGKRRR